MEKTGSPLVVPFAKTVTYAAEKHSRLSAP